jgi:isopenicillin N synthase-like dioxygenase
VLRPLFPSFDFTRDALDEYSTEITNLERRLLGFMAIDLGVSQEALLGAFFSGDAEKGQSIIMNHYPPCRHPEKVLGIRPHTDGLGLTVLLHVDDTPGLLIRRRGGRWLPVRPLPGAFVVNVADILEVLTNGAYVSVEHRVVPDAEKCRTTVVLFQDASVDGVVTPLPELLGGDEAQAARYNSIGKLEYGKSRFGAVAEGTRFLDSLKK